jgi:hypothetical protein
MPGWSSAATPRWTRCAGGAAIGVKPLLVVLGLSGACKSSFLRAGLLPRLRREDRRFLPLGIVRPQRLPLIAQTCSLAVAELRCHRCGVPDGISTVVPKHE